MTSTTSLQDLWSELLKYIGLDQFKAEAILSPDQGYHLVMGYKIEARDISRSVSSPEKLAQWILRPIAERVKSSPAVKDALAEKDKELLSLQEKVMELEQQLSDSRRYKTYFEAEFLLRHGKEVTAG